METPEETPTAEKLLIFTNDAEISRIALDAEVRAIILNKLSDAGLSKEEIISVTASQEGIERHIWKNQLEQNPALRSLVESGITGLSAKPSQELQNLSLNLQAWRNYPAKQDKFLNLIFADAWQVDEQELANLFQSRGYKLYLHPERIFEFRTLEMISAYLNEKGAEPGQILSSSFFSARFTNDSSLAVSGSKGRFMIKRSYFMPK